METAALVFGLVVGWITYFTLRHETTHAISDISAVIGAVGGGAVLSLFPASGAVTLFQNYAIGLGIGFFGYLVIFIIFAIASLGWKDGLSLVIGGKSNTPGPMMALFKK